MCCNCIYNLVTIIPGALTMHGIYRNSPLARTPVCIIVYVSNTCARVVSGNKAR